MTTVAGRKKLLLVAVLTVSFMQNGCFFNGASMGMKGTAISCGVTMTLRTYLASAENEKTGYGGYSYILLKNRPGPDETAACRNLVRAYVNCLAYDSTFLDAFTVDSAALNITYWPLTGYLRERNVTRFENDTNNSQYFIDNYDYNRARKILGYIGDLPESAGPFIVCSKHPLTTLDEPVQCRELLLFDLSALRSYREFKTVLGTFEAKVKHDAEFARGCVFAEKFSWLRNIFKTEAPPVTVNLSEIALNLFKGIVP